MALAIEKYLAQIQDLSKAPGVYAYRGQHDSQWSLYSAATRRLIEEHGEGIVADPEFQQLYIDYHREVLIEPARTRGFGSEPGRRLTDVELLAKLQHFGAATGLLDFSWSPLVALWFASEDPTCDGRLFLVDTNDPIGVARVPSEEGAQKLDAALGEGPGPPHLSYWEPTMSGDASVRILRQRSVFVIGRPLLPSGTSIVQEILVSKGEKEALQRELHILDFSQESLFQDVYGFSEATAGRPVPQLTSEAYRRRGNRHYQSGDYAEARAAYDKSIELAPESGLTYFLRGNVHAACGHHWEAIEDYDRAEAYLGQIHPTIHDSVFFNRGNSKAELSDYEDALEDYTQAIRVNRDFPQAYYNRGNIYADLYRFEEALRDYDRDTTATLQDTAFNKGNALLALGRLTEAQRSYQDAVSVGVDHDGVAQNLGTLEQILPLVGGLEYSVRAVPDPSGGNMCLRFGVPEESAERVQGLQRFLFFGRQGNVGNTGGPGLSGGAGLMGKPLVRVFVDIAST